MQIRFKPTFSFLLIFQLGVIKNNYRRAGFAQCENHVRFILNCVQYKPKKGTRSRL